MTFERIDPLYVVDLSDPTAPAIVGELRAGLDLLHEVNESLLLGLVERAATPNWSFMMSPM